MALFSFLSGLFKPKSEYDKLMDKVGPLLVEAYRTIAEERGIAPTRATSDKEIVSIYLEVEAAFKQAAQQRGETIPQENINTIVLYCYQYYEGMNSTKKDKTMFDIQLQYELKQYLEKGLPKKFKEKLVLFEDI